MAQWRRENDWWAARPREAEQQRKDDKNFFLQTSQTELERQKNKYNKLMVAFTNAESELKSSQLKWRWERYKMFKDMDEFKASYLVKAEEQRREIEKLSVALEKSEVETERTQREKSVLLEEMENLKASHEVRVDEQQRDIEKLAAALKEAEEKAESDGQRWRQEKFSLLTRLDEQTQRSDAFVPALERFEKQVENHRRLVEGQEKDSSLLEAAQSLRRTLQEKERQWAEAEAAMEAKMDQLESQLVAKMSRRKRKFKFF